MYHLSWLGKLILRLRWLLMALLGGLIVFYELTKHGLKALQELEFDLLFESLMMGFILPLLGGYLLTNLARQIAQYARNEERLEQHKLLLQELAKRQEWEELRKFLVQYPG